MRGARGGGVGGRGQLGSSSGSASSSAWWKACGGRRELGLGGLQLLRGEGGLLPLVVEGDRARVRGLLADELVERRERNADPRAAPRAPLHRRLALEEDGRRRRTARWGRGVPGEAELRAPDPRHRAGIGARVPRGAALSAGDRNAPQSRSPRPLRPARLEPVGPVAGPRRLRSARVGRRATGSASNTSGGAGGSSSTASCGSSTASGGSVGAPGHRQPRWSRVPRTGAERQAAPRQARCASRNASAGGASSSRRPPARSPANALSCRELGQRSRAGRAPVDEGEQVDGRVGRGLGRRGVLEPGHLDRRGQDRKRGLGMDRRLDRLQHRLQLLRPPPRPPSRPGPATSALPRARARPRGPGEEGDLLRLGLGGLGRQLCDECDRRRLLTLGIGRGDSGGGLGEGLRQLGPRRRRRARLEARSRASSRRIEPGSAAAATRCPVAAMGLGAGAGVPPGWGPPVRTSAGSEGNPSLSRNSASRASLLLGETVGTSLLAEGAQLADGRTRIGHCPRRVYRAIAGWAKPSERLRDDRVEARTQPSTRATDTYLRLVSNPPVRQKRAVGPTAPFPHIRSSSVPARNRESSRSTPSARSPSMRCRRRIRDIPALPWRSRRRLRPSGRTSSGTTRPSRPGRTATGSSSPTGTPRCSSTRCSI
jgi:hypothetical protein